MCKSLACCKKKQYVGNSKSKKKSFATWQEIEKFLHETNFRNVSEDYLKGSQMVDCGLKDQSPGNWVNSRN